jgi:hypothetical protein
MPRVEVKFIYSKLQIEKGNKKATAKPKAHKVQKPQPAPTPEEKPIEALPTAEI